MRVAVRCEFTCETRSDPGGLGRFVPPLLAIAPVVNFAFNLKKILRILRLGQE